MLEETLKLPIMIPKHLLGILQGRMRLAPDKLQVPSMIQEHLLGDLSKIPLGRTRLNLYINQGIVKIQEFFWVDH